MLNQFTVRLSQQGQAPRPDPRGRPHRDEAAAEQHTRRRDRGSPCRSVRAGGAGATSQTWWPAATHKATDRLPLKSGAAGAGSCSVSTRAKTPGSESDNLNPSKPV